MLFNCDFSIAVEWRFCDFPLFRFVGFVNLFCVYDVVAYDFDFVRRAFACVFGKVNQNLFFNVEIFEHKKEDLFYRRVVELRRRSFRESYNAVFSACFYDLIFVFD